MPKSFQVDRQVRRRPDRRRRNWRLSCRSEGKVGRSLRLGSGRPTGLLLLVFEGKGYMPMMIMTMMMMLPLVGRVWWS